MSKRSITPRTVLNVIVYEAEGAASTKCYAHKAPADIKVGCYSHSAEVNENINLGYSQDQEFY